MNCADLETLLCDYVDGTLHGAQRSAVEEHLAGCAVCAELAGDAARAVAFMERAAVVEPPPELLTRILFELPSGRREDNVSRSWWASIRTAWIDPVLQPRFAMGMAMTVLSFAMLGRFAGIEVRQLKPSDLNPVQVWATVEDKALRAWERGVKYYDSLRLVYEIQTSLKDWDEQADADRSAKDRGAKNASGNSAGMQNASPQKTGVKESTK
jgi:hypothetical protein